jgi:hypothetical protein
MIMDFASFEETSGFVMVENEDLVHVDGGAGKPSVGPITSITGGQGYGVTIPVK